MRIAVITKKNITDTSVKSKIISALVNDGGFEVCELPSARNIDASFERILVFGGDGTVLDAVRHSIDFNIPVLGINLGNLGFLTKFEAGATPEKIIKALKHGKIEKRMLLSACIGGKDYLALNDVVIKSDTARPVHLTLKINGEYVDRYHSDGLIVSTPTGSTAYSLSAGGPVMSPEVDALIIIPVCPHSLHSRPLVVGSGAAVEITAGEDETGDTVIDGQIAQSDKELTTVTVTLSEKKAVFVKTTENNFYTKLLDKMNRWGTTEN